MSRSFCDMAASEGKSTSISISDMARGARIHGCLVAWSDAPHRVGTTWSSSKLPQSSPTTD
jgi:hypothetical protein